MAHGIVSPRQVARTGADGCGPGTSLGNPSLRWAPAGPLLAALLLRCPSSDSAPSAPHFIPVPASRMVDVAKALNQPPMYPTKYFGFELEHRPSLMLRMTITLSMDLMRRIGCKACWMDSLKNLFFVLSPEACLTHIINSAHSFSKTHPRTVTVAQERKKKKNRKGKDKEKALCPAERHHHHHHHHHQMKSAPLHMLWKKRRMMTGGRIPLRKLRGTEWMKSVAMQTLSDDLERTVEEQGNILFDFVKKRKEEGIIDSSDKEIVAEAEKLNVKAMGPLVLTEVLSNEKIREQIKKCRHHFLRFCHNNKKAQRYLLCGLECVTAVHQAQLISKIPHILKEMYDADLLEVEVISWSEKASKKYVSKNLPPKPIRVKAEPLIKWLKEAEEESSGGEEEDKDENMEVVYSETVSVLKVEAVKSDNKDTDIAVEAI
ncbi:hypothetical protein QTO34_020152 [Cnephaeus nilssonii]|uniref:W2 domain-containing protein n=1 Tax=Cnephaeus nilssonii TaxID=3371016 RepID=A0AA40HY13_CNENI|nr:hypothetical protein QTO34_020152 [Eptesicus nilssonii]